MKLVGIILPLALAAFQVAEIAEMGIHRNSIPCLMETYKALAAIGRGSQGGRQEWSQDERVILREGPHSERGHVILSEVVSF